MKKLIPVIALLAMVAACGGGTTTTPAISITGLEDVPATTEMFKTNASASISVKEALPTVSGTAPFIKDITSEDADTYFWDGLLAELRAAGTATGDQIEEFWGMTGGGAGGEVACRMSQSTGYTMANIINAGISLCYMRNMPSVTSGITLTEGTTTPAEIFTQTAADKVVKVSVSGDPEMEDQTIFIKVYGSNSIGSDNYNVDLWFCNEGDTTAGQYEQFRIDETTGELTTVSNGSGTFGGEGLNSWYMSVSGYLAADASGNAVFDPTQTRTADFQFSSEMWGLMKSSLTVNSSNQIIAKDYSNFTGACVDKIYSIAGFSGTNFATLQFNEAGVKGDITCGEDAFTFYGGTEFQTTHYVATPTSELATTADAFEFADDSFFATAPSTPTVDTTSYSCLESYDYAVAMDMSDSAVSTVADQCEAEMMSDASYCDGDNVNAARTIIFTAEAEQGGGGEEGGGGEGGAIPSYLANGCFVMGEDQLTDVNIDMTADGNSYSGTSPDTDAAAGLTITFTWDGSSADCSDAVLSHPDIGDLPCGCAVADGTFALSNCGGLCASDVVLAPVE